MANGPAPSLYLGTISGTSVDALDLALLEVEPALRLRAASAVALPETLRAALRELGQPGARADGDAIDTLGSCDRALGEFIGEAICQFLGEESVEPAAVAAIGSHGQTVRHRPDGENPFTLQIGDPNAIAERTGITTVADFRRRDMAAGGQGAPLVPRFHEALFRIAEETRAILNIGGISNLTLLPAAAASAGAGTEALIGFDCGPGNALMDSWCDRHRGERYDADGGWASTGQVLEPLLSTLLKDDYLKQSPPKSTGREHYNLPWLEPRLDAGYAPESVQRTLLELTACCVRDALRNWCPDAERLVVCGGGRHNGLLMERLAALTALPVETTEALGFDGDALEAAAFAWLAYQRLQGATGNAAAVTGAAGGRVLGAIYPP